MRLGAEDVTILYRRTEAEMPAYDHEIEEAREEGVRLPLPRGARRLSGQLGPGAGSSVSRWASASPTRAAGAGPCRWRARRSRIPA